jgi:hypothetical protein
MAAFSLQQAPTDAATSNDRVARAADAQVAGQ